jgi:hypothetical protein
MAKLMQMVHTKFDVNINSLFTFLIKIRASDLMLVFVAVRLYVYFDQARFDAAQSVGNTVIKKRQFFYVTD